MKNRVVFRNADVPDSEERGRTIRVLLKTRGQAGLFSFPFSLSKENLPASRGDFPSGPPVVQVRLNLNRNEIGLEGQVFPLAKFPFFL